MATAFAPTRGPANSPRTTIFVPEAATWSPRSTRFPPNRAVYAGVLGAPFPSKRATKASVLLKAVIAWAPVGLITLLKEPVTRMFPIASAEMAPAVAPKPLAHCAAPSPDCTRPTKVLAKPALVSVLLPMTTEFV